MKSLPIVLFTVLCGCSSQANLLVGTWEFDAEKTQRGLQLNPKTPKALSECYKQKLCGNGVFIYESDQWRQISTAITNVPDTAIPYTVISILGDQVVIETRVQAKISKEIFHFINDNENYIDLESSDFKWREYFRRLR